MKKMLFLVLSIIAIKSVFGMGRTPPKKRKPYACQQCSKQFYTQEDYTTHSNQHCWCFICPGQPSFLNQVALTEHIRKNRIHDQIATDNMATTCSDCAIKFNNPQEKLYHLAQQHASRSRRRRTTRFDMKSVIEFLQEKEHQTPTQPRKKQKIDPQLLPKDTSQIGLPPVPTDEVLTQGHIFNGICYVWPESDTDESGYESMNY